MKIKKHIGLIAAIVAILAGIATIITLVINIIDMKDNNRILSDDLGRYHDLVITLVSQNKINIGDVSTYLPEKETEIIARQAASQMPPLPMDIDAYFSCSGFTGDMANSHMGIDVSRTSESIKIVLEHAFGNRLQVYWLYPENNWGDKPGRSLSGINRLVFEAKGRWGNEVIEFKSGGLRDLNYKDSYEVSMGRKALSMTWQEFKMDLLNQDLSNVISAFSLVSLKEINGGECTIFLRNIRFE
ncbi:MAG: hypothetical protein CVT49_10810 [candidate division Zixibacteria bacterium HGW-Zixibacteria-1]|nr:MAG: hypothetical protein CVT49_10810 [candidate division Zixibacteria bacterium HGW-Zixibacteria-1]